MKTSLFTIIIVLFLDQLLKLWIKTSFELGDVFLDWGVLKLQFIENPGMAFGINFDFKYTKLILSLFRLFASFLIGFYLLKLLDKKTSPLLLICISLILSGAIGNVIDSVFMELFIIMLHTMHHLLYLMGRL